MATTNGRDWIFTHAFSESSFKTYEKNGLARRDTYFCPTLALISSARTGSIEACASG
jgi:hypothetical protein